MKGKPQLTREQLITWLHQNAGGAEADAIAAMLTDDANFKEAVAIELTCGNDGFSHYCGNCGRTIDRNDVLRSEIKAVTQ